MPTDAGEKVSLGEYLFLSSGFPLMDQVLEQRPYKFVVLGLQVLGKWSEIMKVKLR